MKLNLKLIKEYQKNREPYLFVDEADEVIPGKSAKGSKILDEDLWFFKVHWPGDPNMPGMLQVEALVQLSALSLTTLPNNKGKVVYLLAATNIKFLSKILPNSIMKMETKILNYKRGIADIEGKIFVKNKIACRANFKIMMPDELEKYKVRKNNE